LSHNPYIIEPNSRSPIRSEAGEIEILIGGKWNFFDWPIYLDDFPIDPISVEKITNNRGGKYPFTKIRIGGVEIGKHRLQMADGFVIVFYVNPLY